MVITALAAGDGDAERSEPLAAHREAVAALCWRLFQLLSHEAADVRAGAAQRWAALAARHPSLHRDAFGDSALGAEAAALLAGGASSAAALAAWLADSRDELTEVLSATLGARWREAQQRAVADAADADAAFETEQKARAAAERGGGGGAFAARFERDGGGRAVARRAARPPPSSLCPVEAPAGARARRSSAAARGSTPPARPLAVASGGGRRLRPPPPPCSVGD